MVVGASVNQERTLLAFTVTESYYAELEDPSSSNFPGIYKSFLAEIRSQFKIYLLYSEKQNYQKVQFLYGDSQGSSSKKESHMLFLHHREAIGLYHIPMARIGDKGMIMSSQPRTEQVSTSFIWAQWDAQQQRLYCVHEECKEEDDEEAPLLFAAYHFSEKSACVQLKFLLPFERKFLKNLRTGYLNHSLTQSVSEKHLNMQVVTLVGGSLFVCLQHPHTSLYDHSLHETCSASSEETEIKVDVEYSIYMLHHGCVLHCDLPKLIPRKEVENCRIFFSYLYDYLVVLLPGCFLHLLDCGSKHGPCHHVVLQGDSIPTFQYSSENACQPTTLLYMNKEQTTSVFSGPCMFNVNTGDGFKYSFDKKSLVETFSRTHLASTRSALLHMALVHLRETNVAKKMIQHLCHDPASLECSGLLKEYLVASTYGQIERELDKDVRRLMPITCEEMFRGHLEKDENRKRIARITLSFWKENQLEFRHVKSDRKKEAAFWSSLMDNVENATKRSPRFSFNSIPEIEDEEPIEDDYEHSSASVRNRRGSIKALLRSLSRMSTGSGSPASQDRVTPDFLETTLKTDSEKSHTEIVKQDAVINQLRIHLQNHLPKEPKAKLQNIAGAFTNFQYEQCRNLLRIFWTAFGYNTESNPNIIPLSCSGTVRDVALFQMVQRYYTAVQAVRFPFPSGFETFFTALAFQCLEPRMFLQYVDSGVLHLTKGFVNRLIEDVGKDSECSDIIFQAINRLPYASAKKFLQKWDCHPVAARYLSRCVVQDIVGGDSQTGDRETVEGMKDIRGASSQSLSSNIEGNTFRPLATLMAILRANQTRMVQADDIAFVEANALTEIHSQINGSLGSVPF